MIGAEWEFGQRERIAGRRRQDRCRRRRRQLYPGIRQKPRRILCIQWSQVQLAPPHRGEDRLVPRPPPGDHPHPGMSQPPSDRTQHLRADAVQPLHVIDHQQHRPGLCSGRQQVQQRHHHWQG